MPPLSSGNGRHRRPRQAPAFLVTAGMTGAGIAIPLLGATGAHAADASTWDRVADCESGGLWSADHDNGHYGGLQLTKETWEQYGGTAYAERPDLASRDQQITVGEKILRDKGPDAWPTCAGDAGLTKDSTTAPSESKLFDGGSSTDSRDTSGSGSLADLPDHTLLPAPSESPDKTSGPDESNNSGDSSGSSADRPAGGSGKHRGGPAEHPSRDARDGDTDSGHSARDHRVLPGESLSRIAAEHHVHGGWPALYEHNRDVVGSDPDLIRPGQELHL